MSVQSERLKPKDEESTCLAYTGLLEELEYLKIETRLIDEKFASVMGECVIVDFFLVQREMEKVERRKLRKEKTPG